MAKMSSSWAVLGNLGSKLSCLWRCWKQDGAKEAIKSAKMSNQRLENGKGAPPCGANRHRSGACITTIQQSAILYQDNKNFDFKISRSSKTLLTSRYNFQAPLDIKIISFSFTAWWPLRGRRIYKYESFRYDNGRRSFETYGGRKTSYGSCRILGRVAKDGFTLTEKLNWFV